MFSFFKRNKSPKSGSNNNNNNTNNGNAVTTTAATAPAAAKPSMNMQLAIEKQQQILDMQQASLQHILEQRKNSTDTTTGVNDLPNLKSIEDDRALVNNRLPTTTSVESSGSRVSSACAIPTISYQQKPQHDHSDDRASIGSSCSSNSLENTNKNASISRSVSSSPSYPFYQSNSGNQTTAVASSPLSLSSLLFCDQNINQPASYTPFVIQSQPITAGTYNSVLDLMGKGRNKNKYRGGPANSNQNNGANNNNNKNVMKNNNVETTSNSVIKSNSNNNNNNNIYNEEKCLVEETSAATIDVPLQNVDVDDVKNNSENAQTLNEFDFSTKEKENCEKSLCEDAININIKTATAGTHSHVVEENENVAVAVENGENALATAENVNNVVSLQRQISPRRVTFAPSPPRSLSLSEELDDDDETEGEEETLSEDIFYEATESSSQDSQKLRILSTMTSTSSDCNRINEATTEDVNGNASNEHNAVICASIILSVNNNNDNMNSSSDKIDSEMIHQPAFTDTDDNSISYDSSLTDNTQDVPPKPIKSPYMISGDDDPICLPDILVETNLMEHLPNDEKASINEEKEKAEYVDQLQSKVNDLVYKVDGLERDLALRQWAVERLQSELEATNKEGDCVRQKLKFQDAQLERVKEEQYVVSEEDGRKYSNLEEQHAETVMKLKKMQTLASTLNVQLAQASVDTEKVRQERDEILDRLQAEEKILRDVLETSIQEREKIDAKWKHDFEQLRNVNCDREEHLMEDCEWKIRSMLKSAKEKVDKAEKERIIIADQTQLDKQLIKEQRLEIKQLKSTETEAGQLRGLTTEQCETIKSMTKRVNELKAELETINKRLQTEIDSCQQIKRDCSYQLSEKERETINRIEIARGEIAMEWEDRLMEEMCRLKLELEQCHLDDRNVALNELREESLIATQVMTTKFKEREQQLVDEIQSLKWELTNKKDDLMEAQAKADTQIMEHRSFLERREREHQQEMDRHLREHSDTIDELKTEYKREKEEIKASFYKSLEQIKEEFANEITITTETLTVKHKKELEQQWKHLIHEKESALQTSETRHRIRIEDADNKLSAQMTNYQRQMDDMRGQYEHQQNRLQGRDVQNAQEIDQLHRKCICLTKLFEEMRMRYERRDPRPDDLRQIDELKNVVESQERDICDLTEQLRDLQLQQQQQQQQNKKPPPSLMKTVIYEEECENEMYEEQNRIEKEKND
ncbi:unnamed protein product, partial [Diamesa serratosioi]